MALGLFFKNDSGSIQIDENYKNVAFKSKSTLTLNGSGAGNFTISGTSPVIAYRSSSGVVLVHATSSGSDWTFYFRGPASASITYYVFDEPSSDDSGAPFVVYNASGEPTFNSNERYMRVVDFVETTVDGTSYSQTETYPSGKTYAVVCCHNCRGVFSAPKPFDPGKYLNNHYACASRYSGDSIVFEHLSLQAGESTFGANYNPEGAHLVIDVTGY